MVNMLNLKVIMNHLFSVNDYVQRLLAIIDFGTKINYINEFIFFNIVYIMYIFNQCYFKYKYLKMVICYNLN